MDDIIISYPQLGNYSVPIHYLLSHVFNCRILKPNKITNNTIELGSKYSPDFVCTPFKYTLGTMIEDLEGGANILIQAGGGCRYGYYSELQEQILKDLGYKFNLFNLVTCGKTDIKRIIKMCKKIDKKFSKIKGLYYTFLTFKMIKYMDKIDDYIRMNIGFEKTNGSFEKKLSSFLEELPKYNNPFSMYKCYKKYKKEFKKIEIKKNKNTLKVGIIGELYTVMEPFSNYFLEKQLAQFNIKIKRFTNVHYLFITKKWETFKAMLFCKNIMKYKMAADASNNVYWTKYLCKKGYDGIIHIKSSFCTPEIAVMPIIQKVCNNYDVPIIFFSFDSNTSEVGIKTRIEAFHDMLEMRKMK